MLSARELVKIYGVGDRAVDALRGLSVDVIEGEFLVIRGRSGSGKSTLLHLIGGLDYPTSGDVVFQGEPLISFTEKKLLEWRRTTLGFMFQEPFLVPQLTALENVALPLLYRGMPRKLRMELALSMLRKVGLGARLTNHPYELSGGEAQRVSLARALVGAPKIVLADEPTGELDSATANELGGLLKEIHEKDKVSFVIVTHDPTILKISTRVVEILDGKII